MTNRISLIILCIVSITYANGLDIYGRSDLAWPEYKNVIQSNNQSQSTPIITTDTLDVQWDYLGKPWGAHASRIKKLTNGVFYLKTRHDSWYTSINNGNDWEKINSNIDISDFNNLVEGPDGELYAVSEGILYRSIDEGTNWDIITTDVSENLYVSDSGQFFSINDTTMMFSSDNGESWVAYPLPNQNAGYALPIKRDSSGRLYCVDDLDALYYSDNNGISWSFYDSLDIPQIFMPYSTNRIKRIEIPTDSLLILVNRGDYGFKYSLTDNTVRMIVIPGSRTNYLGYSDDLVMWATSEKTYMDLRFYLMKSTNMGESWINIDNMYFKGGLPSAHPVRFAENSYLGIMGRKGVKMSSDGGFNWANSEDGLDYNLVVSLAAIDGDHLFVGTVRDWFDGGLYQYTGGTNWARMMENTETHRVWDINYRKIGEDIVTYSQSNFIILRNLNLSPTWTNLNSLNYHPGSQYGSPTYYSAYLDRKGNMYTGINDWGIYHMRYNGSVWQLGNMGFPNDYVFFIDEDCHGNIVAKTWHEGNYYISEDGTSWNNWNSYLTTPNSFCSVDSSIIFACTDYGLYKSNNNGGSWSFIQQGEFLKLLHIEYINCLVAAVYEEGVFTSFDSGGTWTSVNDNPSFAAVRDIEIDLDWNLYICTERGGIYTTDYFRSLVQKALLPTETDVLTIYPNPTNKVLSIKVAIAEEQYITWSIYNLRGQVVSVYKDQLTPGEYDRSMVVSELPSGVYFLHIKSSNINKTVKFTVIK